MLLTIASDIGPWIFGLASWFITGIDDLVIFSGIYHNAKTTKHKTEAIAGLLSMVLIMMAIVTSIGWTMGFLQEYVWIGGFLPLFISIKTWRNRSEAKNPRKGTFFVMAFTGFGLNCIDDIVYNTGVISGQALSYQVWYLLGILTGAIVMIGLAHSLFRSLHDMPRVRASVIFLVSAYILWPGIEMIVRLVS